jgi:hypothetical protein
MVRGKRVEIKCKGCETPFIALLIKVRQGKSKFCTSSCYNRYRAEHKLDARQRNCIHQKKCKYNISEAEYLDLFQQQK